MIFTNIGKRRTRSIVLRGSFLSWLNRRASLRLGGVTSGNMARRLILDKMKTLPHLKSLKTFAYGDVAETDT
jgi:hypothetical protein